MFNGQYISIQSVLATIAKYPYVHNITREDLALYLNDFLRKMGATMAFVDRIERVQVKNFRGDIPRDLLYIRGTRVLCEDLVTDLDCTAECSQGWIALRYASDIYHSAYHCSETADVCDKNYDYTYSLNAGKMYTSFEEGTVEISYKGLMIDDEGFPMIPDDVKVQDAFKYYILWQYAEPAYFRKDIPKDVYQEIKTQYYFYVGAARNSLNMPSPDQMKTLENGLIRLIRNTQWHEEGWRQFSNKEFVKGRNY